MGKLLQKVICFFSQLIGVVRCLVPDIERALFMESMFLCAHVLPIRNKHLVQH